jgi:hypothetical protein
VSETRVIHYRDWDRDDPDSVYIGRAMPRQRLKATTWGNPFRVTPEQPVAVAIRRYQDYLSGRLSESDYLVHELTQLSGKTLVCWCAPAGGLGPEDEPLICHGQWLARMADELAKAERERADYYAELADASSY